MQPPSADGSSAVSTDSWTHQARTARFSVADLHARTGCLLRVEMADSDVFTGIFRTEILSARSLSVYISGPRSATLTIDEIVSIDSL
jgi:hypothetical protein